MIGELDGAPRDNLHVQLQSFVDTKLLLGYRYNEWALQAPSMEDANAVQGQAANEFGQANHFMTALERLGTDPDAYMSRDDPSQYRNLEVLDDGPESWAAFLATVGFADMATQVRLQSFEESSFSALSEPAGKAIQEEEFHTQYLVGAVKTYIVDEPEMTVRFREALADIVPTVLYWFGRETETTTGLLDDGILTQSPDAERRRYLSRVTSFIDDQFDRSFAPDGIEPEALLTGLNWGVWDDQRLRMRGDGPDETAVDALQIKGMDAALGMG